MHVVQAYQGSKIQAPLGIWLTWEGMAMGRGSRLLWNVLGGSKVSLEPPCSSHFTSSLLEGNLNSTKLHTLMFGATLNRIDRFFSTSTVTIISVLSGLPVNNCWHYFECTIDLFYLHVSIGITITSYQKWDHTLNAFGRGQVKESIKTKLSKKWQPKIKTIKLIFLR